MKMSRLILCCSILCYGLRLMQPCSFVTFLLRLQMLQFNLRFTNIYLMNTKIAYWNKGMCDFWEDLLTEKQCNIKLMIIIDVFRGV